MSNRWDHLVGWLEARKIRVGLAVVILLVASVVGLFFIPMEHSLEVLLPEGSDTQESIRFLQEIDFSSKIVLSFSEDLNQRTDPLTAAPSAADPSVVDWKDEVDQVVSRLDSPMILKVISRFDDQKLMGDLGFFVERTPELMEADERAALKAVLTPEGIHDALKKKYMQLLKPEGSFMAELIRRDPLDLQMRVIDHIRALSASFGYDVKLEQGHLVSRDGRHKLVMLETSVPFTDSKGSHALVAYLKEQWAQLPDSIQVDMVCGHLHSISNEKVVKRDIALTVSIAGFSFLLLFLLFFKDWRANLIFFLPLAALLISVNVAALLLGSLSQMMLGFGSVIAGVAVDYGIHVYVAVRRGYSARAAVAAIAKPVWLGALTTGGVFFAFLFSSIPGYRQLATFALLSVVLSVLGALTVLPIFLKPQGRGERAERVNPVLCRNAWWVVGAFIVWLIAVIPFALQVEFDSNVACLDGTESDILAEEAEFQEVWGTGETGQAIAAVSAPDLEAAMELSEQVYQALPADMRKHQFVSLNSVWKPESVRRAHFEQWKALWSPQRIAEVKTLFAEQGEPFGFSEDAFSPFFTQLQQATFEPGNASDNLIFQQLAQRFIQSNSQGVNVLSYFPDTLDLLHEMERVKETIPQLKLISRNALTSALARDYTAEFMRLSLIALGFVLAVSFGLLRNIRMTLVVLVPAVAGVLSIFLAVGLAGSKLNVMNLISGIIVIGLCIDYGIFYVHSYMNGLHLGTRTAISLSAGTTLIGVGALLCAKHPALFSVGLTLLGGITAGYVTSMFVVPALCHLLLKPKEAPDA